MFLNYCTPNQWMLMLVNYRTMSGNQWKTYNLHVWDHYPLHGVFCSSLDVGWTHSRMTPWCLLQLLCILCNSTECTVSYVQLVQIATMRVAVRSGLTRGTLCASLHSVIVTHHVQEWWTVLSQPQQPEHSLCASLHV